MISTDKAVNPTSVMGAAKRCAELYIQSLNDGASDTRFVAVRFGNVLASSGSVVPIFQKQIDAGGPVTVTHPDMRRYFMTIPEASQLVMQAGAIGQGGEIFVLDMGEPIRILDLALEMIRRRGLTLGTDVEIEFTGTRPGEKLYEELACDNEQIRPTAHRKICVWELPPAQHRHVAAMLNRLAGVVGASRDEVVAALRACVGEYQPAGESIGKTPESTPAPAMIAMPADAPPIDAPPIDQASRLRLLAQSDAASRAA
jgi:FlaA1/EpsC-like NDP-sugar epimerase